MEDYVNMEVQYIQPHQKSLYRRIAVILAGIEELLRLRCAWMDFSACSISSKGMKCKHVWNIRKTKRSSQDLIIKYCYNVHIYICT